MSDTTHPDLLHRDARLACRYAHKQVLDLAQHSHCDERMWRKLGKHAITCCLSF